MINRLRKKLRGDIMGCGGCTGCGGLTEKQKKSRRKLEGHEEEED